MEELFNLAMFEIIILGAKVIVVCLGANFLIGSAGRTYRRSLQFKAKCAKEMGRCEPEWPTV